MSTRIIIEKAWRELTAPQNETVTSKWYFEQAWKACERSLLASRVILPEKLTNNITHRNTFHEGKICGWNMCIDELLKLNPHLKERE